MEHKSIIGRKGKWGLQCVTVHFLEPHFLSNFKPIWMKSLNAFCEHETDSLLYIDFVLTDLTNSVKSMKMNWLLLDSVNLPSLARLSPRVSSGESSSSGDYIITEMSTKHIFE